MRRKIQEITKLHIKVEQLREFAHHYNNKVKVWFGNT